MATIAFSSAVSNRACYGSARRCRPTRTSRSVVVQAAQVLQGTSRRGLTAIGTAAIAAGLLGVAQPAQAFLGFGDSKAAEEAYQKETSDVLAAVSGAIGLERDAPDRDERIRSVRSSINAWVAKYRRDEKFAGRPSYGNTYSALNALAGHYNSFGTQAPIPKKRLERLNKELGDAQLLLTRGR